MELKYICDNKRHLICEPYTEENLHLMAEQLGIKRHWFHLHIYPHYDIPKKRIEDIQQKCEIVRTKEIITIIKKYQKNKVKFHTNKVY